MIRRLTLTGLLAVILGAAAVLAGPPVAGAHPLGNFTTNTYAGIAVAPEAVRVDYIVDLAEVPALQARQRIDTDGDDRVDDAESTAYRAEACAELAAGLDLMVAGRPVPLVTGDSALSFADGQGGLTTLRLECSLAAPLDPITDEIELALVDHNHPGRLGWREITIAGDGTTVASATAPDVSVSDRLRAYPDAEVVSPLDQRAAEATIRPGGDRLEARGDATLSSSDEPRSRGNDGLTERFLDLVDRPSLGLGFALFALGVATVLGALHALAPGHGKTLMAAYVVGRRGTWRQVTAIGATVAATHTGGVVVLGLAVSASQTFAPEDLFPWFSVVSGALLASVGAGLLYRRMRMRIPAGVGHGHQHGDHAHLAHDDDHHAHDHDDGHAHHHVQHHGHGHHRDHHHGHHHHVDPEVSGWRGIVAMGLAGGLVPSPSALVVLLGAVALGRLWFGIALVAAYGIGMTVTLVSAGLLLVRFRRWVEERLHRPRVTWAVRVLPSVTAALLLLGGLSIVVRNLPNV